LNKSVVPGPVPNTPCDEHILPLGIPELTESDKQDKHITDILEAFKNYYEIKSEDNHQYKKIFFFVVMIILGLITLGFLLAGAALLFTAQWQVAASVMGGGAVTLVIALLKLPEIIATHLFPLEEDKVIVDLVKALKDAEK